QMEKSSCGTCITSASCCAHSPATPSQCPTLHSIHQAPPFSPPRTIVRSSYGTPNMASAWADSQRGKHRTSYASTQTPITATSSSRACPTRRSSSGTRVPVKSLRSMITIWPQSILLPSSTATAASSRLPTTSLCAPGSTTSQSPSNSSPSRTYSPSRAPLRTPMASMLRFSQGTIKSSSTQAPRNSARIAKSPSAATIMPGMQSIWHCLLTASFSCLATAVATSVFGTGKLASSITRYRLVARTALPQPAWTGIRRKPARLSLVGWKASSSFGI
ncbi:hypothetical protein KEM52_002570, partial [Ascosphaera acerosa]